MKTNNEQLKTLIQQHKLSRLEVAKLLSVSPYTVKKWLLPANSTNYHTVKDSYLLLLKYRLLELENFGLT